MGCWNETCLLSRLPITCGQKIACVFIAPVDAVPGTVYTDSQYVPVSLPFYGRYDDYGRIEDMSDIDAAVKSLSGTKLFRPDGSSWTPVSIPSPCDSDAVTDLSDMARQGELWTENKIYANGHAQVRLAFFHQDLWDYAVKRTARDVTGHYLDTLAHKWPAAKNADRAALKDLAAMDTVMSLMRVAWQPTCGTGHQSCIDYPWQARLYKMFAERAAAFHRSMED